MPKPCTMTVCRATNIIRRAVRTYGEGPQMDMMIEEMSELTKAGVIVDDSFKHITLALGGDVDQRQPRTVITVTEETE